MKNLEFRVWNDVDKIYIDWATLKASPILFMNIIKGKVRHHTLEQFSGVLDKNGMKIFLDSDTISFKFDDNVSLSGTLTFNDEEQRVEIDIDKKHEQDGWICLFYDCMRMKDILVIGNIHQNKELIN